MSELFDIRLGWVLAQGTQALADLLLLDLSIASVVEQVEGFLKFCGWENYRSDGVFRGVDCKIAGNLNASSVHFNFHHLQPTRTCAFSFARTCGTLICRMIAKN